MHVRSYISQNITQTADTPKAYGIPIIVVDFVFRFLFFPKINHRRRLSLLLLGDMLERALYGFKFRNNTLTLSIHAKHSRVKTEPKRAAPWSRSERETIDKTSRKMITYVF